MRLQTPATKTTIDIESTTEQERTVVEQCQKKKLNERLHVQFLNGIDERIKQSVMSHDPKTFEEALLIAKCKEMIEQVACKSRPFVGKIDKANAVTD